MVAVNAVAHPFQLHHGMENTTSHRGSRRVQLFFYYDKKKIKNDGSMESLILTIVELRGLPIFVDVHV